MSFEVSGTLEGSLMALQSEGSRGSSLPESPSSTLSYNIKSEFNIYQHGILLVSVSKK